MINFTFDLLDETPNLVGKRDSKYSDMLKEFANSDKKAIQINATSDEEARVIRGGLSCYIKTMIWPV